MTDAATHAGAQSLHEHTPSVRARQSAENRFKWYGVIAIALGLFFLVVLFGSIISKGYSAFMQNRIEMEVVLDKEVISPNGPATEDAVMSTGIFKWDEMIAAAAAKKLDVDPTDKKRVRAATKLLSNNARLELREIAAADPSLVGSAVNVVFTAGGDVDAFLKGAISEETPEDRRQINDDQISMIRALQESGALYSSFNWGLFTNGASSQPSQAGLAAALVGSAYMMLIVLLVALPIGVAASIYLEEFAPKNRWTDLIEVNINNLAAVPSIVFGILGLALFINWVGLPRSAPVVGGLVLSLMTLPTIIITTRAALKAVPPSIRSAALGVGASKMQSVFHHVLPLAAPGVLTGTIIGLAQALGETAPLLLIGMVAFVADVPTSPMEPATALPVQIYMWANAAERAFVERTSAAIIVLLIFMLAMNFTAILLRRRFERRW